MCAALLLCVAGIGPSAAADGPWPSRTVRIIVAQAPGGPPDLIARLIAEPLGRALGVPVVVDNRPGASGIIGVDAAARATPDGANAWRPSGEPRLIVPRWIDGEIVNRASVAWRGDEVAGVVSRR